MSQVFNLSYLFNLQPGTPNIGFWRILLSIAIGAIILGVVGSVQARRGRKDALAYKPWFRLATWGYVTGAVLLLLGFFRFQNAYFLSMRIFVFTWILVSTVWVVFIIKYWLRDIPKKREKNAERAAFAQYLPRKK